VWVLNGDLQENLPLRSLAALGAPNHPKTGLTGISDCAGGNVPSMGNRDVCND
jgi:hypothetical protein